MKRRRKRIHRCRPVPRTERNPTGGLHENVHDEAAGVQGFVQVGMAGPHPFLRIAEKILPEVQGMAHCCFRRNRSRRTERRPPRTGSKRRHPFSGPPRHDRSIDRSNHGYAPHLPSTRGSKNHERDDRILSMYSATRMPTRNRLFVQSKFTPPLEPGYRISCFR